MPALEKVPTGLIGLDEVLSRGLPRRRSTLACGAPGCGKTLFGTLAFDHIRIEPQSIIEHGDSDLEGLFSRLGMAIDEVETPPLLIHRALEVRPSVVVLDVGTFLDTTGRADSYKLLIRLIDCLKSEDVSALMTSLTPGAAALEQTPGAIFSAVDTWILVNTFELNDERNRDLCVLKPRGISHSNQVRDFVSTSRGEELLDAYVGPGGVPTGSARANQEAAHERESLLLEQEIERKRSALERRKALHREQLANLQAGFEFEVFQRECSPSSLERADETIFDRVTMAWRRQADAITSVDHGSGGKP